jgi:hypothetical protein
MSSVEAPTPPGQDTVFYIDAPWESVQTEVEVLNKFKQAPFYVQGCNNDNPEIPLNDLGTAILLKMVGCEVHFDIVLSLNTPFLYSHIPSYHLFTSPFTV